MPSSPGGIRVNPNGQTAVVTFTLPNGGTPVAYSSRSGAGTISLPATVSAETTFWFQEQTTLTVSALVGTQQSATSTGTTATVDLSGGGVAGLTVAVIVQPGGSSVASVAYALHGSNASYARPTTSGPVEWVGSVAPSNAVAGDTWIDSSVVALSLPTPGVSDAGKVLTVRSDHTGYELDTPAAGASSSLLARVVYNPATVAANPITGTSFADVDATNWKITFTAPPSGNVLVRAYGAYLGPGATQNLFMNLRNASSNVAGTINTISYGTAALGRYNAMFKLTGLTSGTSYTYKIGAKVTGSTGYLYAGDDGTNSSSGPLVIEADSL